MSVVNVTKAYLPPIEEYTRYLNEIWATSWLTNNGPLLRKLEHDLKDKLTIPNILLTNNGTIALQLAIRALNLSKEVITTPFSYVATTNALLWENISPVFVDINPETCNINVDLIENSITENTTGILVTHVYGIPCDVAKIQEIASKHKLKVIYDAAHAFGVKINNKPLVNFGDISTLSFHATKLFHTIEGGGIVCGDEHLEYLKRLRAFGHINDEYFCLGINGKNSEFHAAMGLSILPYLEQIIAERKKLHSLYDDFLQLNINNDNYQKISPLGANVQYNYSYYPLLFSTEELMMKVKNELSRESINTRRYFYPSLNKLPFVKGDFNCPVSESYTSRILCIPLYNDLSEELVKFISKTIRKVCHL